MTREDFGVLVTEGVMDFLESCLFPAVEDYHTIAKFKFKVEPFEISDLV